MQAGRLVDLCRMIPMRRGISIWLVLLFALGPLSATLQASDGALLPVCCRSHGAHKCAMSHSFSAINGQDEGPLLRALSHCSYYPGGYAVVSPVVALAPSTGSFPQLLEEERVHTASIRTARLGQLRTRAGRGPPVTASV